MISISRKQSGEICMVFKIIWWIYCTLANVYGAYLMISSEALGAKEQICFVLYIIVAIISGIFLTKNIIKICSPEYKKQKEEEYKNFRYGK